MDKVNLKASPETRAQILQLIALEKLENDKDYTIKSYLEMLVGLAARGKFDEAGKLNIEVKREPVTLRADRAQLLAAIAKTRDTLCSAMPRQPIKVSRPHPVVYKVPAVGVKSLLEEGGFELLPCQATPASLEYLSASGEQRLVVDEQGNGILTVYPNKTRE
jgi:hypothetical protein